MSRRTVFAVGSLIVLAVAEVGAAAPEDTPPSEVGATARLATARDALKAIEMMRGAGQHIDPTKHYLWSRRLMEAERELAGTKAERVAAARAHVDRMTRLTKDIRLQYENHEVSRLEYLDNQFHQDEAVSWLEKERAR